MQELLAKEQQEEQVLRDITGVQVKHHRIKTPVRGVLACTRNDPICL